MSSMPDETPLAKPEPTPPLKREQNSPISDPAAIFIAAATLFAIFINSQNGCHRAAARAPLAPEGLIGW